MSATGRQQKAQARRGEREADGRLVASGDERPVARLPAEHGGHGPIVGLPADVVGRRHDLVVWQHVDIPQPAPDEVHGLVVGQVAQASGVRRIGQGVEVQGGLPRRGVGAVRRQEAPQPVLPGLAGPVGRRAEAGRHVGVAAPLAAADVHELGRQPRELLRAHGVLSSGAGAWLLAIARMSHASRTSRTPPSAQSRLPVEVETPVA